MKAIVTFLYVFMAGYRLTPQGEDWGIRENVWWLLCSTNPDFILGIPCITIGQIYVILNEIIKL